MKKEQKPIAQAELNAILASDYPADFSGRLLVGIHLSHKRSLEMSDFRGAVLRGCTFSHCKFDNSHFDGANLGDTAFVRCKMEYCSFGGAQMENASFDRCALVGSTGLHGDTRTQSEVIFDENMEFVRGVNMDLLPAWRQFAWEMCGPNRENYDRMLDGLHEEFYRIDQAYPGMGAEIFNSGLRFLPQELCDAANYIAKGNTVRAAYEQVVGSDLDNDPLPDHEVFVLPHSDVQKNLLAVRAFAAQIRGIPDTDIGKITEWLDLAWDLSDGVGEDYRQLLLQYGDAFEQIEQNYPGVAAAMFEHQAAYLPEEMHTAAEWIDNGGSPEEAYEAFMANTELSGIHYKHALWREGRPDGERADFTGRELRNLDFTGMDFHEAVFAGASLENCWMNGAGFTCCDFSGASFLHVSAIGADFGSANFDGSSLVRSDFSDADMESTDLSRAEIHDCWGLEGQSFGQAQSM